MSENMIAFLEALSKSKELQDKLNAVPFKTEEEKVQVAIAFAKDELGMTLTEADFAKSEPKNGELSDDELDAVAGGFSCTCPVGGVGGSEDHYLVEEHTCVCVFGGAGEYSDDDGRHERCYCVMAGHGNSADVEYWSDHDFGR